MPDAPGDEMRDEEDTIHNDIMPRPYPYRSSTPATDTPAEALFARILDLRHWTGAGDGSGKRHECKCEDCKAIKQIVHLARQAVATSQSKRAKQLATAETALAAAREDTKRLEMIRRHCRVIYFADATSYPTEHSMLARKDQWDALMHALDARIAAVPPGETTGE